tara:strand:+ start:1120 stop:1953 length:834 start_codon:yes stop_codon:yes gene_type:complete
MISEFAPAKINLSLHVVGQKSNGYHLLDSIVSFANIGDNIRIAPKRLGTLQVTGPFAKDLPVSAQNLVLKATSLFGNIKPSQITLEKNIPVTSGIGGGSADAAATVRLLSKLYQKPEPPIEKLVSLGADVPVCMQRGIVRMMGVGEEIINLSPAPKVGILLVNPRKALSTAEVFNAVKEKNNSGVNLQGFIEKKLTSWFDWINSMRNDLTASAIDLIPEIRFILDKLITCDGARVVRMSGSGATCFALFEDFDLLQDAKNKISKECPSFWCEAGRLI